jgi:hypothetical protein
VAVAETRTPGERGVSVVGLVPVRAGAIGFAVYPDPEGADVTALIRRVRAGLKSCWVMPCSSYPSGTYVAIFFAACWFLGRSWWETDRVNALELSMALATGALMVGAFWAGFKTPTTKTPPEPTGHRYKPAATKKPHQSRW